MAGLPLDFLQNSEPKLLASDLTPVAWPGSDPGMVPAGHGDLYTAILASGVLRALVEAGYRYASVSNADNLGAAPDPALAAWFASREHPTQPRSAIGPRPTAQGGHLAVRRSDSRLILRDTAQTPPDEMDFFTDIKRHPFFHTNNLWFDLQQLAAALRDGGAVLGLPSSGI